LQKHRSFYIHLLHAETLFKYLARSCCTHLLHVGSKGSEGEEAELLRKQLRDLQEVLAKRDAELANASQAIAGELPM